MINNTHEIELEKKWRQKFPSILSNLFAFYQCVCTLAIIACELGSVLIDVYHCTIYIGFWASLFFIAAWISQIIAGSCRFTRKCATYTLIIQCISLFFAVCIIGFDAYFISYPTTCFFSLSLCNSTKPIRGIFYSTSQFNDIKIPLIKGQLAAAALMFAFYIVYIIIYVVTCIKLKRSKPSMSKISKKHHTTTPIDNIKTEESIKTAQVSVTDKNVIKLLSPSATNINVSTSINNTSNTISTETKDTDVSITTENVIEPILPLTIDKNVSTHIENSISTKIVKTDAEITKENTIESISLPNTDMTISNGGTIKTSLVESLHRSRWSIDSDDLIPIKI
ncbi:unnamed protein product [Adineta steineri]|uniref:Uncharacterized protein n=1 Tax=Adineta steineri TaxID=433720 RepID=A0A818LPX1_9BILA|nr:unnamed protein product [Adineta steineri]CAF3576043.1 unnamed protein product [Adineta steineri]